MRILMLTLIFISTLTLVIYPSVDTHTQIYIYIYMYIYIYINDTDIKIPEDWTEKARQVAGALLGAAQVGGGSCSLATVDLKGLGFRA